jgi:hypothetical protein
MLKVKCCVIVTLIAVVFSQPPGWKMVDRFYGFRYEIVNGKSGNRDFMDQVKKEADSKGCFGWIQETPQNNLVGEIRCSKTQGPQFLKYLEESSNNYQFHSKIYEDTKIRLHFSTFKILESSRDTCFRDPPHQCPEYASASSSDHDEL